MKQEAKDRKEGEMRAMFGTFSHKRVGKRCFLSVFAPVTKKVKTTRLI